MMEWNPKGFHLKNRQHRLEDFKPSKRYTILTINTLANLTFCRFA
jgi:hypothetical protein